MGDMLTTNYVNSRGRPFKQLFQRLPFLTATYTRFEADYDSTCTRALLGLALSPPSSSV
jgi:hypothetical protein